MRALTEGIILSESTVWDRRSHWNAAPASGGPQPIQITVRRDHLLEDGFSALKGVGSKIKGKLQVSFVNLGVMEAGLDHGGLVKEFLEEV